MRARDGAALFAALAFAAAGCSIGRDPHPPTAWIRPVWNVASEADGFGAWVAVRFEHPTERIEGELIAANADTMMILTPSSLVVRQTRDMRIVSIYLGQYASGASQVEWQSGEEFDRFAKYARFPAGVPAGIDPRTLTFRPGPTPGN